MHLIQICIYLCLPTTVVEVQLRFGEQSGLYYYCISYSGYIVVKLNCRALECVLKKTDDTLYMNEILILWFIVLCANVVCA